MIPWLDRFPTPDEVRAHAAAHPVEGWPGWGYWLCNDVEPVLMLLSADEHGVWLPDGDEVNARRLPNAKRWLPCTAEGLPVCLLRFCRMPPEADMVDPEPII